MRPENKEIPPIPESPTESEMKLSQDRTKEVEKPDQVEVSSDRVAVDVRPSDKAEEAAKEPAPTESKDIFVGYGSFEKLSSYNLCNK